MATSVYFNGKLRTLPGVYSTITSGESNVSRSLDYGTVLLIDTGVYGAGWGGGSGVNGALRQGKDSVYEFTTLSDFRSFVKGGMFYKCAEALWTPDPYSSDAVGISRLLYARACTTTSATMVWEPRGGGSAGGKLTIQTIDEGENANGEVDGGNLLKGYAYTLQEGSEDGTFRMNLWVGTYTGEYTDPVTGVVLSYDELTKSQAEPTLLCQSPDCTNLADLINWCNTDSVFGARFMLVGGDSSKINGDGTVDADDIAGGAEYQVASGATEEYKATDLEALLNQIKDVQCNIIFSDQVAENGNSAKTKEIIAFRNTQAKFDAFVYVAGYPDKANFQASLQMAKAFNSAWVVCVHGGIGLASDMVASGIRWWGSFYNLCQVIGRVCGKPPYVPVTNKTIGGDRLQHTPTDDEMEKAINAGLVVVYPNPYLNRFVILQGVTTLQDNKSLFNKKAESFSIQFMRVLAQLNRECVVNAAIDLLGDENGVNINTLSKGSLETWTINFLQSRVATDSQDNLIISFQNVNAERIEDYYNVTYEVVVNSEVTKLFFTGYVLRG